MVHNRNLVNLHHIKPRLKGCSWNPSNNQPLHAYLPSIRCQCRRDHQEKKLDGDDDGEKLIYTWCDVIPGV